MAIFIPRRISAGQRFAIFACAMMLLPSCAVGPNYKRPSLTVPAAFKEAPPLQKVPANFVGPMQTNALMHFTQAVPGDGAARGKWWEIFGDSDLNLLEEQISINNQNVKAAEASFRQARALVAESRAAYFPTLGISGSMTRSAGGSGGRNAASSITSIPAGTTTASTTGAGTGTALSTGTGVTTESTGIANYYNASADASWAPDLWGRIRREVEAGKAGAQASFADLASARLSAQGELAADYLDLRLADEQKRILENSAQAFGKSMLITQNQYKSGVAAASDVLQAKVLLENTQAQAADVGVARAQFEHAIAVLIGKGPGDFAIAEKQSVPQLPQVPAGVPSQLLQRRPDIAAAERRVAAANAQIGVAEAAYFPDLTLSASGGYASTELYRWFTLPTRFWSLGPSLAETLFDAGLRAAQTEAAIASYDQTVATYRQTALSAFQAVEDNLTALRIYAQEAAIVESAVADSKKEVAIFINQYKAGTVSYLNVVTAQTSELNSEITALNVRKGRLTAATALIQNLGGGWNVSELKKPDVTQGRTGPLSILPPHFDRQ